MEINVESKNKKYAKWLQEIYCGKNSDFLTFMLFEYGYILLNKIDNQFALNMKKLSNDSLLHFEIIGKLISLLGEKPTILIENSINCLYLNDKKTLLEFCIRLTKDKIIKYTEKLDKIDDTYIKEILKKFIIEERKNLKILEILQLKNKISNTQT